MNALSDVESNDDVTTRLFAMFSEGNSTRRAVDDEIRKQGAKAEEGAVA